PRYPKNEPAKQLGGEGNSARFNHWAAAGALGRLLKPARRRVGRRNGFRMEAITHPNTTTISIPARRGRNCKMPCTMSSVACVSSLIIVCHILTSLPPVPHFQ